MPVKVTIKRDAYVRSVTRHDVMTIIIILLQHLYKVIIVYLASRLHTQEVGNVNVLLRPYHLYFNTFMILIKSGLHAYISAITIFQLP